MRSKGSRPMSHQIIGQAHARQPLLLSPDPPANGGAPRQQLAEEAPPKIQAFEQRLGGQSGKRHEESWKRSPNVTGHGAIHVKTFHCKLNNESLDFLDQQVNEWLDAHPQYEVKLVTSTVGDWTGKTGREPNLVIQVWV
jgi:hypothetical protein